MTLEEIKKKKTNGLFTVTIELANAFDEKEDDENAVRDLFIKENGESHTVELREFNSEEMLNLQKCDKIEIPSVLNRELENYIIGSSIKHDNGEQAKAAEVSDLIKSSSTLVTYVLQEWQNSLPLVKRMRKESAALHP